MRHGATNSRDGDDSWGMFIKGEKSYYNKKDRKEICFISSFSVICVWDEPAIKIVNLNI